MQHRIDRTGLCLTEYNGIQKGEIASSEAASSQIYLPTVTEQKRPGHDDENSNW